LRLVLANEYGAVVLDVMLQKKDGLTVCREIRAAGMAVRILMLTARDTVENRVAGLDCGADDYLVKSFDFRELLARVRALLRRVPVMQKEIITVGDLSVDTQSRSVSRGGAPIELTAKEFTLVEYLARHAARTHVLLDGRGAGLGLPIARCVAEAHNWSLDLLDSSNRGSTFVVMLPYDRSNG
jgi:DNA-binding response OmpR family regulator